MSNRLIESSPSQTRLPEHLRDASILDEGKRLVLEFENINGLTPLDPVLSELETLHHGLGVIEQRLTSYRKILCPQEGEKRKSDLDFSSDDYLPDAELLSSRPELAQMKQILWENFRIKKEDPARLAIGGNLVREKAANNIDSCCDHIRQYRAAVAKQYVAKRVEVMEEELVSGGVVPVKTANLSLTRDPLDVAKQTGWAAGYALDKGYTALAERLYVLAEKCYGNSMLGLDAASVRYLKDAMVMGQLRARMRQLNRWKDRADTNVVAHIYHQARGMVRTGPEEYKKKATLYMSEAAFWLMVSYARDAIAFADPSMISLIEARGPALSAKQREILLKHRQEQAIENAKQAIFLVREHKLSLARPVNKEKDAAVWYQQAIRAGERAWSALGKDQRKNIFVQSKQDVSPSRSTFPSVRVVYSR